MAIAHFLIGQQTPASTADWVVTIETKTVDNCLKYPDSKLQPLIRTSVHFEQALLEPTKEDAELLKRGAEQEKAIPPTLYETLYSSHSRTVGLRRFKQMIIKPGSTGTIKVTSNNLNRDEAAAAANASIRLFLDLYLNKMPLRSIVVPREIFDIYVQEIQRFGFRPVTIVPGEMMSALIMLSVRSDTGGRQQYLSYTN